ncbi:hypothetical protein [Burkholderia ubonensis]|uniref:hypothetical protein n=1 Tax=Burkholderia ubonensis TaxID=101571 RepID=UPI000756AABD|nr:hypothetical protein [Burkholderia ubonensis]KVO11760.1 hypothetical protein WJ73_19640 [Burkholderia ubonensis]
MTITTHQIELLHHTLGLRIDRRESYRNHFVAGPGHHDMPDLEALEGAGLMARVPSPKFLGPDDVVFMVTDDGFLLALDALPEPSKRTRYDDFMDYDGCISFGEYLCGNRLPQFENRRDHIGRNTEYRMYRYDSEGWRREIEGAWAPTMKEAKASYKAALKEHQQRSRFHTNAGAAIGGRADL